MYTSIVVMALTTPGWALAKTSDQQAVSFFDDYAVARREGQREKKPLAVFVGRGPMGWKAVTVLPTLTNPVRKLLTDHYIPVYLDTTLARGRQMANALLLDEGLVLTTHDGGDQAFRHEGKVSCQTLKAALHRYSDPSSAPVRTEVRSQVSPAPAKAVQRSQSNRVANYTPSPAPAMQNIGGFNSFGAAPSFGGSAPAAGGNC
jgi:hypothetical protein